MKMKKTVSAFLAGIMAASAFTAGADAASSKLKLQTVSIGKIEGADYFQSIGGGYYGLNNADDPNLAIDVDEIVYIGADELKKWQEKGKFTYKKVKTDFKTTDMLISGGFTKDGSYMQFGTCGADRSMVKRYIATHNEDNTEITTAYTKGSDWSDTNPDGYTVEYQWNPVKTAESDFGTGSKLTVAVTAPDGTKKSKTLTYKSTGGANCFLNMSYGTGKYVAYLAWKASEKTADGFTEPSYKIYGVKKNGKFDVLYTQENIFTFRSFHAGENWFSLAVSKGKAWTTVYLADQKKTVTGNLIDGISGKIYGTRAVAYSGSGEYAKYFLANFSGDEIKNLSAGYSSMSTNDGKIFLVKNDEGKWGYLDKNGKELAFFDGAGAFIGDYAPVLKNGKAYLVDRNMKRVSEKVSADSVGTLDDGLWQITKGDKTYLMTYKK